MVTVITPGIRTDWSMNSYHTSMASYTETATQQQSGLIRRNLNWTLKTKSNIVNELFTDLDYWKKKCGVTWVKL